MNSINLRPIAYVRNNREVLAGENWPAIESVIELSGELPEECPDEFAQG